MKRTSYITGINGFTGKYMASLLAESGHDIYGLSMHTEDNECNWKVCKGNLLNKELIKSQFAEIKPNYVVHLAGISSVTHGDSELIYQTNLIGTRNLLEALKCTENYCPEAILIASSANVYGNSSKSIITEETSPKPENDYAVSKLAMEYMCNLYKKSLPIIIARPFNYTGSGQSESFIIPKIVAHAQRKENSIKLGNINVERDFSDVRTIVKCYERLLYNKKSIGKTFNVCSGKSFSLKNIIDIVEEISSHKMKIEINSELIRNNEVKRLLGDRNLLESVIGPIPDYTLEETLYSMLKTSDPIKQES